MSKSKSADYLRSGLPYNRLGRGPRPLDVIGISTGVSIVQHFAADHPDLVRRLVLHSSAYVLSDSARQWQLTLGESAQGRQWKKV